MARTCSLGVGKTHLSIALGREAILAGYTVQFTTATTPVAKAYVERRLDEKTAGTVEGEAADRRSARLPSAGAGRGRTCSFSWSPTLRNRRHAESPRTAALPNAAWCLLIRVVASQILDRLAHHIHLLTIRGDRYCFVPSAWVGAVLHEAKGAVPDGVRQVRVRSVRAHIMHTCCRNIGQSSRDDAGSP